MKLDQESRLVARCRRGEGRAWDELFDLFHGPVSRFVFQLSPDFSREDAEEISQETFLSVVRNIGHYRGESQLQTWIFRIASNKSRDFRERKLAAKRGGGTLPISLQAEDPETGLTADPPCPLPAPDEVLLQAERCALVGRALEQMEPPCREVIELRYFADLSYEEISKELQVNQKTVSSRLSKCLDRLEKIAGALFSGKKSHPFPV
jgi:RNA polymerase sigma-70 factor, ECF subfamily